MLIGFSDSVIDIRLLTCFRPPTHAASGAVGLGSAETRFSVTCQWCEGMSSQPVSARFRIGIDTGGTFTDIVSVDTLSGATQVTKVASTPANPGIALLRGVNEILAAAGATTNDVAGLAHGTTVATNALLQGEINSLGLIVNAGFRHILEIARQSVPEGYGNSYFWVKPDRIVPLQFVREAGGRLEIIARSGVDDRHAAF